MYKLNLLTELASIKIRKLNKYIQTPKILLMYMTPNYFIFLHKKYCATEEQYEKICNLVANFPQGN